MAGRRRGGFTIPELLVVVAIVLVLAGLALAAVLASRESARRVACANNLRRIGVAIRNYAQASDAFPPGHGGIGQSFFVAVLPFLDQAPLYNAFNFRVGLGGQPANMTAASARLGVLLCPADGWEPEKVRTNYAGNTGSIQVRWHARFDGMFGDGDQLPRNTIRPAEVRDGLAHTAMVGEFLGSGASREPDRIIYVDRAIEYATADDYRRFCKGATLGGPVENLREIKGVNWTFGQWICNLYDHFLPVNAPSCINSRNSPVIAGSIAAGSRHRGGANTLAADGRVVFVSERIDPALWTALGTRAGGEIAALPE